MASASIPWDVRLHSQDALLPLVVVKTSDGCDEVCRRSGLGLADLLRPYSFVANANITIKAGTGAENPYVLRHMECRFLPDSDYGKVPTELADHFLQRQSTMLESEVAIAHSVDPVREIEDVDRLLRHSDGATPWFDRFRNEYWRSLRSGDHETFDHPVAVIIAVSTHDADPLRTLDAMLLNMDASADIYKKRFAEPDVCKIMVLVHDVHADRLGPSPNTNTNDDASAWRERSVSLLASMKSAFGASNCRLLEINSLPPGTPMTGSYQHMRSHNTRIMYSGEPINLDKRRGMVPIGARMSDSDQLSLSTFVADITTKLVVPWMEGKISRLIDSISNARGGIKNTLKHLMWRKPKTESATAVTDANTGRVTKAYEFHTTESNIRRLADLAFMLNNYDLACRNYRLVCADYKEELARIHYAGAEEMSAICLLMIYGGVTGSNNNSINLGTSNRIISDSVANNNASKMGTNRSASGSVVTAHSRKPSASGFSGPAQSWTPTTFAEIMGHLENAYVSYERSGAIRYATRVALVMLHTHLLHNQHRKATRWLIRCSSQPGQGDLPAGMMIEQAAYCFLSAAGPWRCIRKGFFHFVLAGYRFMQGNLRQHALRCYKLGVQYFSDRGWSFIEDHVNSALARQSFHLGLLSQSLEYFLEIFKPILPYGSLRGGCGSVQTPKRQSDVLQECLAVVKTCLIEEDKQRTSAASYAATIASDGVVAEALPPPDTSLIGTTHSILKSRLFIPVWRDSSAKAIVNDYRARGDPDGGHTGQWHDMEEALRIAGAARASSNNATDTSGWSYHSQRDDKASAVGEEIILEVEVVNSLDIPVDLSDVSLLCEYGDDTSDRGRNDAAPMSALHAFAAQQQQAHKAASQAAAAHAAHEALEAARARSSSIESLSPHLRGRSDSLIVDGLSTGGGIIGSSSSVLSARPSVRSLRVTLHPPDDSDNRPHGPGDERLSMAALQSRLRVSSVSHVSGTIAHAVRGNKVGGAGGGWGGGTPHALNSNKSPRSPRNTILSWTSSGAASSFTSLTKSVDKIAQSDTTGQGYNVILGGRHISPRLSESAMSGPSFVCTSESVSLRPSEVKTIRLKVTPHRPGQLQLLGVVWTIAGTQVTGQHMFRLKGKRLFKTKQQRMSTVYAPDRSLLIAVVGQMPLLKASIEPFPRQLAHGEIVPVTCSITNSGNISADNVRLMISHPQFVLMDVSGGQRKTLNAPAKTGVGLRPIPISQMSIRCSSTDRRVYEVPSIPAGGTFVVQGWVRADSIGLHRIHLLYYCEPPSSSSHSAMRYRLLPKLEEMTVFPFVKCRAFTSSSSCREDGEFLLGVEVENVSGADEGAVAVIRQLVSVSSVWAMKPLEENYKKFSETSSVVKKSDALLSIQPGEKSVKMYSLRRRVASCSNNTSKVIVKNGWKGDQYIDMDGRTHDRLSLCNNDLNRCKTIDLLTCQAPFNDILEFERRRIIENRTPHDDIDLVVLYTTTFVNRDNSRDIISMGTLNNHNNNGLWNNGQHVGQLCLCSLAFLPTTLSLLGLRTCPVKVVPSYPLVVNHKFSATSVSVVVPVTLTITNHTTATPIAVTVETFGLAEEESQGRLRYVDDAQGTFTPPFLWLGIQERHGWRGKGVDKSDRRISPDIDAAIVLPTNGSSVSIALSALFLSPGCYNLSRFRVRLRTMDGPALELVYIPPSAHLINIVDSDSTI